MLVRNLLCLIILPCSARCASGEIELASPEGTFTARFRPDLNGTPQWRLSRKHILLAVTFSPGPSLHY